MSRMLLRMERALADLSRPVPPGFVLEAYRSGSDQTDVARLYGRAFGDEPWGADWESFEEFDSDGVFVAFDELKHNPAGFVICFRRAGFGYISVVAVAPEYQRMGLASALVARAAAYLRSLDLQRVRIDAWQDSHPAVITYTRLGFKVYERKLDDG